ncbi:2-oxoacid:acceptor oxidoreductase family protein [Blautia producta]|uniref:2-oxoacid:acceptor oxidoreductase family protein n=1 Tax=Blautia producta TaxID=33035 RepID=UPI003A7F422B
MGRNISNTAMLGAFAKITGLVDKEILFREIEASFGEENRKAAETAYDKTKSVEV